MTLWTPGHSNKCTAEDIMDVFHTSDTPLEAIVHLGKANLSWLVRLLMCAPDGTGDPLILMPFQSVMLALLWNKKFPMIMACRGAGKTFMLAVYALLRAILVPGEEILMVGKAFRQSKKVFEYIEKLYNNSPLIKELVDSESLLKRFNTKRKDAISHGSDRYEMYIGLSRIIALPIGDGESIRGQRACVDPNTIVETDHGLMRIKDSFDRDSRFKLYTGRGDELEPPKKFVKTQPIDAYRIRTVGKYEFICSDIHRVYTTNGFKDVKELTLEDRLVFENNYSFPEKYVEFNGLKLDEDLAWAIGLLVAEGSISDRNSFSVKMTEIEPLDKLAPIWEKLGLNVCRYEKKPYLDARFNCVCKRSYDVQICNKKFRAKLAGLGLEYKTARYKTIPWAVLASPKSVVLSFLSGLFHGDGSAFLYKDKHRDNNFGIAYYTGSEQLSIDLQVLVAKLGIFSARGFRKSKLSDKLQYHLRFSGRSTFQIYDALCVPKWTKIHNEAHKDCKFINKRKYIKIISIEKLPKKRILYDYMIPKAKSFMGNCFRQHNTTLLVDEFASVNEEVLEVVITPFLSVHKNPQKRAETNKFLRRLESLGADDELIHKILKFQGRGNQMVISGTASSQFNHFYRYYLQYKDIINSRGDARIIRKAMGQTAQGTADAIPEEIIASVCRTWRDYVIYQLPYTSVPEGYLDDAMVARNRLMFTAARFKQEYECQFPQDTGGFIPYSLIKTASPIGEDQVIPELYGEPGARYVMGIDPARLKDYFGIVILKLRGSVAQLVYAKSFYRREFSKIVPHIVDLTKRFNIVRILMDNGGGGVHVKDMLKDPNHIRNNDDMIFDIDDLEARYKTYGQKILQIQNFSNQWIDEAINAMKSDIEHNRLLFPLPSLVNSEEVLMAQYARALRKKPGDIFIRTQAGKWSSQSSDILDRLNDEFFGEENNEGDVVEDGVIKHIDETILETCAIEQQGIPGSQSVRYDLPKIPNSDMEDVRHRDRYTALLLASQAVRIEMALDRSGSSTPGRGAVAGRPGSHRNRGSHKISKSGTMRIVDYSSYYKKMRVRRPK
jgi:intein/homing endonuclease